jgi:serine/threonine protein kinase
MRGYRLLEQLGGGTFGVVYKALSSGGVAVAVKEIRYSVGDAQAQRELEALELIKGLRHPYLLALHDFWVENDRLYMAMNLADGTLAQLAAASGPNGMFPAEALPLFEQAAAALDFLHENHVLHRDVKPANILVMAGVAQVADLGLAKFNPDSVAVSQNLAGTAAYMAPETFRTEFRAESDQYALALCYAEVRLGRQISEGTHVAGVMHWHLFATPDLKGLRPHEEKAVRRALSKNPAERFRSCQEFVQALQAPPPQPRPPRRWLAVLALLLALPLLALVVWRLWPSSTQLPPPPPPPPPPVRTLGFDPDNHGFLAPAGTALTQVDELGYYVRIVKKVGAEDVVFLLVPKEKPDDPPTFYVMENKVSNGLFKVAERDPDFQQRLQAFKTEYPTLKWDQWHDGGVRDGDVNIGDADDRLPVLRVNAFEARCFAL